jgi:hypothetical protein
VPWQYQMFRLLKMLVLRKMLMGIYGYHLKQPLNKKERSIISVDVEIKNHQGMVFCNGRFNWFVYFGQA